MTDDRKTKRQRADASPATTVYTLDSAVDMLMKKFDETNAKIDSFKDELNSKLDSIKLDFQKQIDVVKNDIDMLKSSCDSERSTHQQSVCAVKNSIECVAEDFHRLENRAELIAVGIPYLTNENLQSYLLQIAKVIGFDESKVPLIHGKRLRSGNISDGTDCLLLVQFPVSSLRDEFYAMYLAKRDLKLSHIGLNSDRRIYINENLTVNARSIKRAALKLRRENKLAAVSTKMGTVHVKKQPDGPSIPVTSLDQLMQF